MTPTHWIAIAIAAVALVGGVLAYIYLPGFRTWVKTKGKAAVLSLLKTYVYEQAKVLVEQEYPRIAAKVLSGELTSKDAIKAELYGLGGKLKGKVKIRFADDLPILGNQVDDLLDDMIRFAADHVSPFPGKETAAALLEHQVSDALVNKGVEYVRGQISRGNI